jgi:uncharacterized membrane protein
MTKIKKITYFGIGIALYVVLGLAINIPLLAGTHLQTDLGYIVFGAYCMVFGWEAFIVGAVGCLIESLVVSGWVPYGWILGQIAIGIICGAAYKTSDNKIFHLLSTLVAVFIGIVLIKTVVECTMFGIPYPVKLMKNTVAFVADVIPMLIGMFVGYRLKDKVV